MSRREFGGISLQALPGSTKTLHKLYSCMVVQSDKRSPSLGLIITEC